MFTVGAVGEARVAVGGKIFFAAVRAAAMMATLVDVKALILRPKAFVAEMPFAGEKRGVAVFLERLGEGEFFKLQLARVRRGQQARVAAPRLSGGGADVIGHARPRGIAAGHDARARGAAHRTCGIGIGKLHS